MSCGLHDAMQLEARGIPVVMLATDAFRRSVDEQLAAIAFPTFQPIYVPHPVASLPPAAVWQKADAALGEVVARLTGSAPTERPPAVPRFRLDAPPTPEPGAADECEECSIDAAERQL